MSVTIRSADVRDGTAFVAAISIEGFTLLLPQQDLHTFEPVDDVKLDRGKNNGVGWIEIANEKVPVFSISSDFSHMDHIPQERRIVVILTSGQKAAGVLCDSLKIVSSDMFRAYPIPSCMVQVGSPFTGLGFYSGKICAMSSGHNLFQYLHGDSDLQYQCAES